MLPQPPATSSATSSLKLEDKISLLKRLITTEDTAEHDKALGQLKSGIKDFGDLQMSLLEVVNGTKEIADIAKLYSRLTNPQKWGAMRIQVGKLPLKMLMAAYIFESPGAHTADALLSAICVKPSNAKKLCDEIEPASKFNAAQKGRISKIRSAAGSKGEIFAARQTKPAKPAADISINDSNIAVRTNDLIGNPEFAGKALGILASHEKKPLERLTPKEKSLIKLIAKHLPDHLKRFSDNCSLVSEYALRVLSSKELTDVQCFILGSLYAGIKTDFPELVKPIEDYFGNKQKPEKARVKILNAYRDFSDVAKNDFIGFALKLLKGNDVEDKAFMLKAIFYNKILSTSPGVEMPLELAIECQLVIDAMPENLAPSYLITKGNAVLSRWEQEANTLRAQICGDTQREEVLKRLLDPEIARAAVRKALKKKLWASS